MLDEELPRQISIDVTPMATIALILVIIFVSSATTWMQPILKVELPKASTSESERRQNSTISIAATGEVALDDRNISWEALPQALKAGLKKNRDKFVIVRADKKATYGQITRAMAAAKSAGAQNLTIATEQKVQAR